MVDDEAVEANKRSAERGWIGEPPRQEPRTPASHATKWYKMMGAGYLLDEQD